MRISLFSRVHQSSSIFNQFNLPLPRHSWQFRLFGRPPKFQPIFIQTPASLTLSKILCEVEFKPLENFTKLAFRFLLKFLDCSEGFLVFHERYWILLLFQLPMLYNHRHLRQSLDSFPSLLQKEPNLHVLFYLNIPFFTHVLLIYRY